MEKIIKTKIIPEIEPKPTEIKIKIKERKITI